MPIRDEQLERSMHAAAPRVSTVGVLDRVADKRARRRTVRHVELGALAAVLIVALSSVVVLAQDDDQGARVAAPGSKATARVITGPAEVTPNAGIAHPPVPVALGADPGYVRGPLVVSGSTLSLAAYDHSGDSFTYPPSRIVQLDNRTFHENGRTNLKAEILSIADGEGARWVVTRNMPPTNGLPDAFLKRIASDGTIVDTLLPPGTDVVGPVVAGPGSVWIPVRDGVLRYDPAVNRVVGRVDLPPASARWVVNSGGASFATDGSVLRRLVPAAGEASSIPLGPEVPLVGIAQDGPTIWAVLPSTVTGDARPALQEVLSGAGYAPVYDLPRGFAPTAVFAAGGRVWVEGTAGGSPAVVLLGGEHAMSTVVLDNGRDASFAWVSADTLLAVSNGTLLRIDLTNSATSSRTRTSVERRRECVMRLTRTLSLVAVVVIVAAVGATAAHAAPARKGLLYLGSGSAITAVSPDTGAVQFTKTPAIATRDWSRLYSTQPTSSATLLTTSDARSGKTVATRRLAPNLGVRAVSDDGRAVVLTESVTGANPYVSQPRSSTSLTVVRIGQKPRSYLVQGNVEPEAFSLSTRSLFVIEYTPPTAPDRYRVARIDLTGRPGTVKPHTVRGYEDELQEPMRGTARAQTIAPDGRRLYTLYTRDATATEPAESFVHVLDLENERANCIDLPPEFAVSTVGAVAVSPSGTRLYVVAPAAGALAEIDTAALRITRTATLPEPSAETTVRATVAGSTTLYVAMAGEVTSVDLTDLAASGEWYVPGTVTGIQPAASSRTLFVSLADRVLAVDPKTGSTQREFVPINAGQIDHVAPALRPIVEENGSSVQCAC